MKAIDRLYTLCSQDTDDCIEWDGSIQTKGYGVVKHEGRTLTTHRAAFFHANGFYPQVVMHTCDNRRCVNVRHLKAGTHKDNALDKVSKSRQQRGLSHPSSKMTEEQVLQIKELQSELTQDEIATKFGVSQCTVSNILRGVSYRDIISTS